VNRFYIETFGCQMNVADSGLMTRVLESAGYCAVSEPAGASVVLLNTCAVREKAEERVAKRLRELRRLKRLRPDMVLGVTGCMAKHLGKDLLDRLPHVDLLVGPDSYRRLPELIEEARTRTTVSLAMDREEDYAGLDAVSVDGIRAFVPIMRGCDRFCTFCVVPLTRGREKSLPLDEILRQVEVALAEGAREVTFLGQTVNSYHHGPHRFADLLDAASRVPGLLRVRFTSPHPSHFDEDQFRLIAERGALCPQVHLPVQSGSDRVLADMKRGYTRAEYLGIVERLRRLVPEVGLTTDIITGFPGETDDDFAETLSLMETVRFDSAFMFAYSPRPGTYAWSRQADDVPDTLKRERLERVIALQETVSLERYRRLEGREVEVLVEGPSRRDPLHAMGRAPDGKTVILASPHPAGSLVTAKIARANSHTLLAEGAEGAGDTGEERAA